MRLLVLLLLWLFLAGQPTTHLALAQAPQELRGTLGQFLSALRPEIQKGVIFLGLPGDEPLWAHLYPYILEGRAKVLTPLCPARSLNSPYLLRLPTRGRGYLALLGGKGRTYLLTGPSPLEVRGVALPAKDFPYLARQLNLAVFLEREEPLPRCP